MRPTRLRMSAFGPFAGVAEVDFTLLGTEGIYLLAGETGAGKTTIFDAITFALFGQCSGELRKPEDLRSDYASPDMQTFVDLTFELRGKSYRIKRDPGGYPRAKKRGEGTTICLAEATLEMPDGSQLSGKRVTEKVVELLGIDANQFGQIVMLAQGDFEKLLTEGTKERTAIFRKIFGTDMYQRFQDELGKQRNDLAERCEDGRHEAQLLARQALGCMQDGDEPKALLSDWVERNALQAGNALEAFKTEKELLDARHNEAAQALDGAQAKREKLARNLDRAQQADATRARAAQAQSQLDEIAMRIPQLEASQESCAKAAEELPGLQQRAGALRDQLPNYARHTEALTQEARAKSACAAAQTTLEARSDASARAQANVQSLDEQVKKLAHAREALAKAEGSVSAAQRSLEVAQTLKDAAVTATECDDKIAAIDVRLKKADMFLAELGQADANDQEALDTWAAKERDLAEAPQRLSQARLEAQDTQAQISQKEDLVKQLSSLECELITKTKAHQDTARAYSQAADTHATRSHELENLRRAYEDGLAGVLAAGLAEGQPCPVCGATDHPHLALVGGNTPSKDDVQAAQKREAQAREHASALCGQAEAAHKLVLSCQESLDAFQQANGDSAALSERISQLKADLAAQRATVQALEEENAQLDTARREQAALHDRIAKRAQKRQEANSLLTSIKEQLAHEQAKRQSALEVLAASGHDAGEVDALLLESQRALDEAVRAQQSCQRDAQALRETEGQLDAAKPRAEEARAAEEAAMRALEQAKQDVKVAEEHTHMVAERLEFADEAAAQKELASIEGKARRITAALDEAREALQAARTEQTRIASGLETLRHQLEQLGDYDTLGLTEQLAQADETLTDAKKRERAEGQALATLVELTSQMTRLATNDAKLQETFARLDRLAQLANGSMAGTERLTFETFVQMRYFEVVLAAANTRLSEMTQGQYELVRCERLEGGSAKVGLNVDVLDNFTGKARSAKSLSGGEKFMASLALALGLSEVVQRQAGGIQLDTMFVDEGFGSLDQEKLRLVMRAMSRPGSSGKLVGIISHVEELMGTIDRKIVVERGREGSTLRVEV